MKPRAHQSRADTTRRAGYHGQAGCHGQAIALENRSNACAALRDRLAVSSNADAGRHVDGFSHRHANGRAKFHFAVSEIASSAGLVGDFPAFRGRSRAFCRRKAGQSDLGSVGAGPRDSQRPFGAGVLPKHREGKEAQGGGLGEPAKLVPPDCDPRILLKDQIPIDSRVGRSIMPSLLLHESMGRVSLCQRRTTNGW